MRTPRRSPRSAVASTACRWPSNWPPPGYGHCPPVEIVDSLHDRFRLLTGGARTAVTATTDAARLGGLVARAADRTRTNPVPPLGGIHGWIRSRRRPGCGRRHRGGALPGTRPAQPARRQVAGRRRKPRAQRGTGSSKPCASTRSEKLGESGEADDVRGRHRDHYRTMAAQLDAPATSGHQQRVAHSVVEMDNLRAAFVWSRENRDITQALELASFLQPLWLRRGAHSRRVGLDRHRARRERGRRRGRGDTGCGP